VSKKKVESVEIAPVKGRPMLHWSGKASLDEVRYYPAQLCEQVGVDKPAVKPSYEAFIDGKKGHNFLLHGDNKEVLSTLLVGGFRGKVDLVYIDPPFDSKADYVREVHLRGEKEKLEGDGYSIGEQVQYEDIWVNDNYLQFMYERLILLHELLSEQGSIYLHCDWHKSHHLRLLMDEIFGEENFMNDIAWCYTGPRRAENSLPRKHDNIFLYAKSKERVFNQPYVPHKSGVHTPAGAFGSSENENVASREDLEKKGKALEECWIDIWTADRYRSDAQG